MPSQLRFPAQEPLPCKQVQPRRRIQFSLRTILILTTGVAVGSVLVAATGPSAVAALVAKILTFAAPVICVTAAIYSRGNYQAFFVGVACLACLTVGSGGGVMRSPGEALVWLATKAFALAAAGGVAVATRHLIERRGWHKPAAIVEKAAEKESAV